MSKFKVGDRVKSLGIAAAELGQMSGTIVGKDDGDNWEIAWDETAYSRINWHDEQIAHLHPTGPVIEETVKRIVPGIYGRIEVRTTAVDRQVCIGVTSLGDNTAHFMSNFSATELRAAAVVLNQLAEALDAKG